MRIPFLRVYQDFLFDSLTIERSPFLGSNVIKLSIFYADYVNIEKYGDMVTRMKEECEVDARSLEGMMFPTCGELQIMKPVAFPTIIHFNRFNTGLWFAVCAFVCMVRHWCRCLFLIKFYTTREFLLLR